MSWSIAPAHSRSRSRASAACAPASPSPSHMPSASRATCSVCAKSAPYCAARWHTEHVAPLALGMWDGLGEAGAHAADPRERDLLWAGAMLHDIGTAVDYDDHHKHSRYLILNAGLPGYTTRETALIGQITRYHRKGNPSLGPFAPLARDGDERLVTR